MINPKSRTVKLSRYESYEMLHLCSGAAHPSPNWQLHVLNSSQLFIQFAHKYLFVQKIMINCPLSLPFHQYMMVQMILIPPPPQVRGGGGGGQWPLPLSLPPRGVGGNGPKFAPNCTWHPWVSNPVICNQRQINVLLCLVCMFAFPGNLSFMCITNIYLETAVYFYTFQWNKKCLITKWCVVCLAGSEPRSAGHYHLCPPLLKA